MNRIFRAFSIALLAASALTAFAGDGSFADLSKYVSFKANSLGYVDIAAFRGNPIVTSGIARLPLPEVAELVGKAVKLMDIFDAAMVYGSTDDETVNLVVYGSKLTDVASLEAALKTALPPEAAAAMAVEDIDGRKVLRIDSGAGFVELEPGVFLLNDIEDIPEELGGEKGMNEQLALQLDGYSESKAFGVIAMPGDDSVPPFMEYTVITLDPVGDDSVKLFNTIILGEGMHVDTTTTVSAKMIDSTVAHVMGWYMGSIVGAKPGAASEPGQEQSFEQFEEVEVNEVSK